MAAGDRSLWRQDFGGAPYFELTFVPLMVPLLLAIPFGPLLAWKRGDLRGAAQRLYASLGIANAGIIIVTYSVTTGGSMIRAH